MYSHSSAAIFDSRGTESSDKPLLLYIHWRSLGWDVPSLGTSQHALGHWLKGSSYLMYSPGAFVMSDVTEPALPGEFINTHSTHEHTKENCRFIKFWQALCA